jgi:hypothetical protein
MNEPDRFKLLSFDIVKEVFSEELSWMRANRFKIIEKYPDFLDLLSKNQFSHWHVCQVRRQMDIEIAEKAKEEADKLRVTHNPASLTGGYQRQ